MSLVSLTRRGAIALVTIDNPPVNALAHPVRSALLATVVEADEASEIGAIVITGAGKHFVAGAEIREFDADPKPPLLVDVLARVEACRKPVIAALHGQVLGGGLELALASHYRCATPDTRLGFPEINLGLLPGAGGTQRMPRLIGVQAALEMMLSAESIDAGRALELGIVDTELPQADFLEAALMYAQRLVADEGGTSTAAGSFRAGGRSCQGVSGCYRPGAGEVQTAGSGAPHRCGGRGCDERRLRCRHPRRTRFLRGAAPLRPVAGAASPVLCGTRSGAARNRRRRTRCR